MKKLPSIVHFDFKFNDFSYTEETLKELAYTLIKEGEPFEKSIGAFLLDWLDKTSKITVQTSGSTGIPKQVVLEKEQMANSAKATSEFFGLEPTNTALLCLSADYIAGKMMLVRAMVLGLHLDVVAPSSNPLANIERAYDFSAMVPLQVENSLPKLRQIQKLIIGGAPVSYPLRQKIQLLKTDAFETYGMTETSTHVAIREITSKLENSNSRSFKGLPNVAFSIDDRNCLQIDAPEISDTKVVTNDIVNLISTTEFEWLGRHDNVVNSGALKLHPEKIEEKLGPVMQQRFFVAGVPDLKLGQKLILIIESNKGSEPIDKNVFLQVLEQYEIPKEVISLPKFVLTENGKLKRRETFRLIEGK